MRHTYIIAGILLFFVFPIMGQPILILENSSNFKNHKYYPGDDIILKITGEKAKIADEIVALGDSVILLAQYGEVRITVIEAFLRENWLVRIVRGLTLIGGTAYLAVDSFNRLINQEGPVIQQETLIISGSMVAFSFALAPFNYRKIKLGDRWKVRVIDPGSL
jgi:hypothetical protein